MKVNSNKKRSVAGRLGESRRGQATVAVIGMVLIGVAMAAVVGEFGTVYFAYQQLLAQTEAAALAGGSVMSNDGETGTEVENVAKAYSGGSGDANTANTSLMTVTNVTATAKCLTSATAAAEGVPACDTYSIGENALQVTETATVPTTFARALGWNSWTISATAMASAKGGFNGPFNVAIIVDTTESMTQADGGNCNGSRITCALEGVQTLLSTLSPCAGGLASCGSASSSLVTVPAPSTGSETANNVPQAVDEVSLLAFPGLASTPLVSDDLNCPTKNPPITSYNGFYNNKNCTGNGTPISCCTSNGKGTCNTTYTPPAYMIVPFSSDYRTSDTIASLTKSSDLVIAAGGGCSSGLGAPGGEGTFYAGVIDTAQSALTTAAADRPNTKNVMILVSDGEANADANTPGNTDGMEAPTPAPSKVYASTGQCAQAVAEAQKAASAGTTVYAVAYGAEPTGCSTDSGTYSSPVCTMQGIANSPSSSSPGYTQNNSNFFTDVTSTKSGCASDARSTATLNEIFKAIAGDLTVSRLIPASTT